MVARSTVEEAQARVDASRAGMAGGPALVQASEAAVASAQAAAAAAEKNVEVARAAYDHRVEELKRGGGKSLDAAVAEKQLEIARLTVESLEQQVEDARIRAPFDGVVGGISLRPGDQVLAHRVVGTLADPTRLEVSLDFPVADAVKVSVGQAATVRIADGEPLTEKIIGFQGTPTVGTTGETRAVRVSLDPKAAGVALGAPVSGVVTGPRREDVLLVPVTAVTRIGERATVQVVSADGRRRDVEIRTGVTVAGEVEILQGLSEGQTVLAG
jgi:RND family efflux transporter MFP subunit